MAIAQIFKRAAALRHVCVFSVARQYSAEVPTQNSAAADQTDYSSPKCNSTQKIETDCSTIAVRAEDSMVVAKNESVLPADFDFIVKCDIDEPGFRMRRYGYLDWTDVRTSIVDGIVKVLQKSSAKKIQLDKQLYEWDGIVGSKLVYEILRRIKRVEIGFAFFKWASKQHNYTHDAYSYDGLISLLLRCNDLPKAVLVYKHILRAKVQPQLNTLHTLIYGLCDAGEVDHAVKFLEEMQRQFRRVSVFACNVILSAMYKVGRADDGWNMFKEMESKWRCKPDSVSYNTVISALSRAGKMSDAVNHFYLMLRRGSVPSVHTYRTIANGFIQQENMEEALKFFDLMKKKGLVLDTLAYELMICAYKEAGNCKKAHEYFEQMIHENCPANRKIYNTVIGMVVNDDRIEEAVKLMHAMLQRGFTPNGLLFGEVVTKLCESGNGSVVHELFDGVRASRRVDGIECAPFVISLCENKRVDEAVAFYHVMLEKGRILNDTAFIVMFRGLCTIGKTSEACEIFRQRTDKLVNDVATDCSIVKILCDFGKVDEALEVSEMMNRRNSQLDEATKKVLQDCRSCTQ